LPCKFAGVPEKINQNLFKPLVVSPELQGDVLSDVGDELYAPLELQLDTDELGHFVYDF